MDLWWRVSDDQISSNLFDQAFAGGLPVSSDDASWSELMSFLHQTYDYDNLSQYSELLDEDRLSQSLQDMKSGSMTLQDFARLDLEQREIITQALFRHLDPDALQDVFASRVS